MWPFPPPEDCGLKHVSYKKQTTQILVLTSNLDEMI